MTFNNFAIS